MPENKPFVIRLRPGTRALLDAAASDQRRSRASLVDQLIRDHLKQYESATVRLDRMLNHERPQE